MKKLFLIVPTLAATPAFAASGPFFSLDNTDFVVTIAFVLFVAVLVYLKVPGLIAKMLDDRAEGIQSDLDEARSLREEAQTLLASYERKQREVAEQSERIIATAKEEANQAAEKAKQDLQASIARRLQAAVDQISSAEAAAIREVRDTAITVAVAAASDVISAKMTAKDGGALIDASIKDVADKLH
jgi:F-type H+-transporting ATPase subunit b